MTEPAEPSPEQPSAPARPPVTHRWSTALWSLAVPAVLLTAAIVVTLGWRDELPDPVASHWGADGVDGFSSLTGLITPLAAITAVFSLAMWAVGQWLGRQAMTRRFANGMAVWLAGLLGSTLVGSLWIQRGLTDATQVGGVGSAMAVSFLVATALGGLAAWATPGDPPAPTARPVPPDAPRLAVSDGEQLTWVRQVGQRAVGVLLLVAVIPLVVVGIFTRQWLVSAVVAAVLVPLLVAFVRWTVTVDRHGLTVRSVLRFPRLRVPLDEVERAEVVDVHPFAEFGGWGLRTGLDGRVGVVLRAGPAIQVHRTGGRITVVTVDDAETAVSALNTLAARDRSLNM